MFQACACVPVWVHKYVCAHEGYSFTVDVFFYSYLLHLRDLPLNLELTNSASPTEQQVAGFLSQHPTLEA